jgi:hypothetical protein
MLPHPQREQEIRPAAAGSWQLVERHRVRGRLRVDRAFLGVPPPFPVSKGTEVGALEPVIISPVTPEGMRPLPLPIAVWGNYPPVRSC